MTTDAAGPREQAIREMCPNGCGYEAAHCGCDLPISMTRRELRRLLCEKNSKIHDALIGAAAFLREHGQPGLASYYEELAK
jgi:hypothetical protein